MSSSTRFNRVRLVGIALVVGFAFAVIPATARSATVDLGTAESFVALGGSTVTNTGPSVLSGDLGVAPGTSIVGFGSPAVVNGATHVNNGVANQAQSDLTTAYDVAAAEPVPPGNVLTGTDLGTLTLTAGAYSFASSAQLTGPLTLDAENDPDAQFVFQIGSTLTTASASSVLLVNGASPCNVFWQVGSSATIGSATAFQGNVMALTSISVNSGATVSGRLLARNGAVTLINNVLDASMCGANTDVPAGEEAGSDDAGTGSDDGDTGSDNGDTGSDQQSPESDNQTPAANEQSPGTGAQTPRVGNRTPGVTQRQLRNRRNRNTNGRAIIRRSSRTSCVQGFRAAVRGHRIKRVVFRLDGKRIAVRPRAPFAVNLRGAPGRHNLRARVFFTDRTKTRSMNFRYRTCARALRQPRSGPSQFTG